MRIYFIGSCLVVLQCFAFSESIRATPQLLDRIVREQRTPFDTLGPYTIVYEEHSQEFERPGEAREVINRRTEQLCGDCIFSEHKVERKGKENTEIVVDGAALVEMATWCKRLVLTPTQFAKWHTNTGVAHIYDYSDDHPLAKEHEFTLASFRLRYFEQVARSAEDNSFSTLASAVSSASWQATAQIREKYLVVAFHRAADDNRIEFTLDKERHYLVVATKWQKGGKPWFESQVQLRDLADETPVPESWTETWYAAYTGYPGSESKDGIAQVRMTRVLSLEQNPEMDCSELDWRLLQITDDVIIRRRMVDGSSLQMEEVDGVLMPRDMILD